MSACKDETSFVRRRGVWVILPPPNMHLKRQFGNENYNLGVFPFYVLLLERASTWRFN